MKRKRILLAALVLSVCGTVRASTTVILQDIDSGLTSPAGVYRWLDVADQVYAEDYRNSYDYTQADVTVDYSVTGSVVGGTLAASNLKPNFAYQLKLVGSPGATGNEGIGLAGRWWQEQWNGSNWAGGQNLNSKGDGSSPNPNDEVYFSRRDIPDATSPTGKKYRYTGYLVFDYFITDENGDASLTFATDSSFHVLWKTSDSDGSGTGERVWLGSDGVVKAHTFEPTTASAAYDSDYGRSTVSIFGEWERLPVGGLTLLPGTYDVQFLLTEESFHGSGVDAYDGGWAGAMAGSTEFVIVPVPAAVLLVGMGIAGVGVVRRWTL